MSMIGAGLLVGIVADQVVAVDRRDWGRVADPVYWLAFAALLSTMFRNFEARPYRRSDILAGSLIAGAAFLPFNLAIVIVLLMVSVFMPLRFEPHGCVAATVALLCSLHLALGETWFAPVLQPCLEIEALAVAGIAEAAGLGIKAIGNVLLAHDGRMLVVLRDCSTVGLLLTALVVVASIALRRKLSARAFLKLALVAAVIVLASNIFRLSAMVHDQKIYAWLHDGIGGDLFAITVITLCGLVAVWPGPGQCIARTS
jgi:exosortase/archaeosortase family protein